MDPFDRSRCSFHIPEFKDEAEEKAFFATITPQQSMEVLELMRQCKFGYKPGELHFEPVMEIVDMKDL